MRKSACNSRTLSLQTEQNCSVYSSSGCSFTPAPALGWLRLREDVEEVWSSIYNTDC